jgi:hypothetical protein
MVLENCNELEVVVVAAEALLEVVVAEAFLPVICGLCNNI